MPEPCAPDAFRHHFVDRTRPGAIAEMEALLRSTGLVTLDGLTSRSQVLAFAKQAMDLVEHRDSDADLLTTIRAATGRPRQAGYAGFGTGALAPHTERSSVPEPPRLMLLACGKAAGSGGESLLIDGRTVYAAMHRACPDAVDALARPRTAYFGNGDGHPTQIFTRHGEGRISIRLRTDALARFSPLAQPYLPQLHAAVARNQVPLALKPGQAYLIDNERWLHARNAFTGARLCWRALGTPHHPMPHGFKPMTGRTARPRVLELR
ncbi:TauD/TfdA family dioxygenase [Streptomyces venezuelae]|uniref:TauD/TfdA family dioxygenase n=1 Tax=Streptomyces venezuelae TaxID=54571 RepID=UPI003649C08C